MSRIVTGSNREQINKILDTMRPEDAIALIESIGKERRKKNSIRVSKGIVSRHFDIERPDLQEMK